MPHKPFVSVIVPAYNGERFIHKCLYRLVNQSYPKDRYEVIVVDNGSEDQTVNIAQSFGVHVLLEEKKSSYAARNLGIQKAKGEILAFTDVDCVAEHNWLEEAVLCMEANPKRIDLLSGNIKFFYDGNLTVWGYYDIHSYLNQQRSSQLGHAVTANLFVRKELFHKIGLFDGHLRSGGDIEWSSRASMNGNTVVYQEQVIVNHPVRNTFKEISAKSLRVGFGNGQVARRSNNKFYLLKWRHYVPPLRKFYRVVTNDKTIEHTFFYLIKMMWTASVLHLFYSTGMWLGYFTSNK